MKSGPSPSEASVEEGEETHSLRKKPVADLEGQLVLETDIGRRLRKRAVVGEHADGGGSARFVLKLLRFVEVDGQRRDRRDAGGFGFGSGDDVEMRLVQRACRRNGRAGHGEQKQDGARPGHDGYSLRGSGAGYCAALGSDPYSNTASGLSRLSEPSSSIPSAPSAATTRSMERVWSISPLTPPMISASPSALPRSSIMS